MALTYCNSTPTGYGDVTVRSWLDVSANWVHVPGSRCCIDALWCLALAIDDVSPTFVVLAKYVGCSPLSVGIAWTIMTSRTRGVKNSLKCVACCRWCWLIDESRKQCFNGAQLKFDAFWEMVVELAFVISLSTEDTVGLLPGQATNSQVRAATLVTR